MPTPLEINKLSCQGCGLCAAACPAEIFFMQNGHIQVYTERVLFCISCAHCMAICPTDSIQIEGLSYEDDLFQLPSSLSDPSPFENLLNSRRSIRTFSDKPVDEKTLQKIIDLISQAPMGFPPHKTAISIIRNQEKVSQSIPLIAELYDNLIKMMKNPVARFFIKRKLPPEKYFSLKDHVLPSLSRRVKDIQDDLGDSLTRGAPVFILFHAERNSPGHTEDAHIALTYGLLAAHALGLGALANGLLSQAVERSPQLRELFNIPANHEVVTAMGLGYAKHKYKKGIKRQLSEVSWV